MSSSHLDPTEILQGVHQISNQIAQLSSSPHSTFGKQIKLITQQFRDINSCRELVDGIDHVLMDLNSKLDSALISNFQQQYPPHRALYTLITSLGYVTVFSSSTNSQESFAAKESIYWDGSENPFTEALFLHYSNKDQHKRILNVICTYSCNSKFIQITKKAQHGTVYDFIHAFPPPHNYFPQMSQKFIEKCCFTLDYCHNHLGIAHLDIKPENIFVDHEILPIFGDFGMARLIQYHLPLQILNSDGTSNYLNVLHVRNRTDCVLNYFSNVSRNVDSMIHIDSVSSDSFSAQFPFSVSYGEFLQLRKKIICALSFDIATIIDQISLNSPTLPHPYQHTDHTMAFVQSYDEYARDKAENFSRLDFFHSILDLLSEFVPDLYFNDETLPNTLRLSFKLPPDLGPMGPELFSLLSPDLSSASVDLLQIQCGTFLYCAPEVFTPFPMYDPRKADVYTLGVVFFFFLFGFMPFKETSGQFVSQRHIMYASQCHPHPPIAHYLSARGIILHPSIYELLDGMMDQNPATRKDIKQVVNTLHQLNWPPIFSFNQ